MLEVTDLSVTEIAFATGFGSLASFRRQFARAHRDHPQRLPPDLPRRAPPGDAVGRPDVGRATA